MTKKLQFIVLALSLVLTLAACGSNSGSNANGGGNNNKAGNVKIGKKDITILGDNYESSTARMYVMKQELEKMGYNVTLKQVGVGTMFAGLSGGSGDISLAVWLPNTHASYWKQYKNKLTKLSKITNKVPLGLTVPTYMKNINSIQDLANNKDNIGKKLKWNLTGISAGAGEMKLTENKVMPAYGLNKKWHLIQSSGPAMIASLKSAIKAHKPIVVTLWKPHWAFVKWHLKILKDPKNKYGKPDDVYAVSRKGFKKDSPAAAKLLSQYKWTKKDDEAVMLYHQKGMSWSDAAKKFLKNHKDLDKKWMKGLQ